MSSNILFSVIGLLISSGLAQGQDGTPVKISTFFETLCPDSIRFITEQLEPTYNELKDIMNIDLHAYGKASDVARPSGEGYVFTCQHGPDECYGNKVLGCSEQYLPDYPTYIQFTFCVMGSSNPPSSGQACATELGVSYAAIAQCANSTEGEVILHNVGEVQSQTAPDLYYVPWIIINDVFTETNLIKAQRDLKGLVCDTYQGTLPSACGS